MQLQDECDSKVQLDAQNRQLEAELSTLRAMEKSFQRLDRNKKKLEDEIAMYKVRNEKKLSSQKKRFCGEMAMHKVRKSILLFFFTHLAH